VRWLRSVGAYTGPLSFARGTVSRIDKFGDFDLVTVDWGNPDIPGKVIAPNLTFASDSETRDW
jgi:hypothetical protein